MNNFGKSLLTIGTYVWWKLSPNKNFTKLNAGIVVGYDPPTYYTIKVIKSDRTEAHNVIDKLRYNLKRMSKKEAVLVILEQNINEN
jgi:hypothetical protein